MVWPAQQRMGEGNNWRPAGKAAGTENSSVAAGDAPGTTSDISRSGVSASDLRIQKASEIGRTAWQPAREMAGSSAKVCLWTVLMLYVVDALA